MASGLMFPIIGAADYEVVVFILVGLVWLIANLLKKAAQASGRSVPQPPQPRIRRPTGTEREPGAATLADFFKRLREMSGQQTGTEGPREFEAEQPVPRVLVPIPPPRRPHPPKAKLAPPRPPSRPPVRQTRAAQRFPQPKPAPKRVLAEVEVTKAQPAVATPSPAPETDAYVTEPRPPHRISTFPPALLSAPEAKRGIILSEILGPPKALRRRRTRRR